MLSEILDF